MVRYNIHRYTGLPPLPPITQGSAFEEPMQRLKLNRVKYRPRKIRNDVKTSEGRLLAIKKHLVDLFREERIELPRSRADECRQYAERLIQLAIQYGDKHRATMEMADYWLDEKELIHKLFKVYVPRFERCPVAFTRSFRLPIEYHLMHADIAHERDWKAVKPGNGLFALKDQVVLELRGNPYPPVISNPDVRETSLLNILLDNARKQYYHEKQQAKQPGAVSNSCVSKSADADLTPLSDHMYEMTINAPADSSDAGSSARKTNRKILTEVTDAGLTAKSGEKLMSTRQ